MTENIRVLTRNIRILGSLPPPAPAWNFSSGAGVASTPDLLLCKLCIQEAGQGEADLDKIIWKDLRLAET